MICHVDFDLGYTEGVTALPLRDLHKQTFVWLKMEHFYTMLDFKS